MLATSTELDFPDVRGVPGDASAPACLYAVITYFGVEESFGGAFHRMLEASQVRDVRPEEVTAAAIDLGLDLGANGPLTLADLQAAIDAGQPVICAIEDTDDDADNPHYVVVIGVEEGDVAGDGAVIVQDPSRGRLAVPLPMWAELWQVADSWGVVLNDAAVEREWQEVEQTYEPDDAAVLAARAVDPPEAFARFLIAPSGDYLPITSDLPATILDRLQKMRLPNEWISGQIAVDPNTPLQVMAQDNRGRQHRVYLASAWTPQSQEKFLSGKEAIASSGV